MNMSYTFPATFWNDRTDKDGESKLTLCVPMSDVETIAAIKKKFAGQQILMSVTIVEDASTRGAE